MDSPQPTHSIASEAARDFAVEVVQRLRSAGFQSLWAGGCVRDQLLGVQPKDYDVATNAEPEQVRQLFGKRRTLALGAAFGVITVIGTKESGNIEVATFRRDAGYSDGRHPDSVTFSTAEHDAQRRDFTINGLFYDPLAERTLDFVGGKEDLRKRVIRAIGDPHQRFNEDKLRILRAIRFASVLDFQLEDATREAIVHHAPELVIVSAERIATELRKMLGDRHRRRAVEMLAETGLLEVIVPEFRTILPNSPHAVDDEHGAWYAMLSSLERLDVEAFPVALALLLRSIEPVNAAPRVLVEQIGSRLKLSNEETGVTQWLVEHEPLLANAPTRSWPEIQRLLIQPEAQYAACYLSALADSRPACQRAADFCREKLALPSEQLHPAPLITGADLIRQGWKPGPAFKQVLDQVRDLQLTGIISSREEALAAAGQVIAKH